MVLTTHKHLCRFLLLLQIICILVACKESLNMAKELRKHTFGQTTILSKAFKRSINVIINDCDQLSKNIQRWYKLDDEDTITLASKDIIDEQKLEKHTDHQTFILTEIDIIREKCDKLSTKIKNKKSFKNNARLKDITMTLDSIESAITHDIHRKLQQKRRKEMYNVCRLERVENKIKVHNFTTINVNAKITDLLNHGPNHIPTIPVFDINKLQKLYLTNIIKQITHTGDKTGSYQPLRLGINNPVLNNDTKIQSIQAIEEIINISENKATNTNQIDDISDTLNSLIKLSNRNDIVINIADKNIGFVINNTTWYVKELRRQLSDKYTYIEISGCNKNDLIDISTSNLNKLKSKYEKLNVDKDVQNRMTIQNKDTLKLPSLNLLPKIHKLDNLTEPNIEHKLKGRPIVNGFQFTTSRISRILNEYMINIYDNFKILFHQYDLKFPCIVNSDQLIAELKNLPTFNFIDLSNIWFVTFDFESLYTNITRKYVLECLAFARETFQIDDLDYEFITDLYDFMQHNSFFHIGNKKFYRQINGLTMGSYDAQLTSNNVLLYHEFQLLQDPIMKSNILNYSRYIDDGFCIIYGSQTEVFQIIDCMKRYLPSDINIEFNVQKFKINYLDLWITIDYNSYVNGRIGYHIFQKEFNTYTYVHRDSNHHPSIFKGLYLTECTRYKRKCSNILEYEHMKSLLELRLRKQGYSCNEMKLWYRNYKIKHKPIAKAADDGKIHRYIKVTNENALNLHRVARKIIRKYRNNKTYNFKLVFINKKKLKELTLTKAKLHNKIGKFLI